MRAHELKTTSYKKPIRSGRGISAGRGKTAGRGTKGQNSRTGGKVRPGFEGGQNPLIARIPKMPGFKSRRIQAQTITLADLDRINETTVDVSLLAKKGIISDLYAPVKVVNSGKLSSGKTVKLQSASKQAIESIKKAGGVFDKVDLRKKAKKLKSN